MSVHRAITSTLLLLALLAPAYGQLAPAERFEDLFEPAKLELTQWAETCVLVEGEVWCGEPEGRLEPLIERNLRRVDAQDRFKGPRDPRQTQGAPVWYRLSDKATAPDLDGVALHALAEKLGNGDEPIRHRRLRVTQVTGDGLLVTTRRTNTTYFIPGQFRDIADDDWIEGYFQQDGLFQYTSILGATNTVRRLRHVNREEIELEASRPTAEQLFEYLRKHELTHRPLRTVRLNRTQSAQFRTHRERAGAGMYRNVRTQTRGAEWEWEWVVTERRINLMTRQNPDHQGEEP